MQNPILSSCRLRNPPLAKEIDFTKYLLGESFRYFHSDVQSSVRIYCHLKKYSVRSSDSGISEIFGEAQRESLFFLFFFFFFFWGGGGISIEYLGNLRE